MMRVARVQIAGRSRHRTQPGRNRRRGFVGGGPGYAPPSPRTWASPRRSLILRERGPKNFGAGGKKRARRGHRTRDRRQSPPPPPPDSRDSRKTCGRREKQRAPHPVAPARIWGSVRVAAASSCSASCGARSAEPQRACDRRMTMTPESVLYRFVRWLYGFLFLTSGGRP